MDAPTSRSYIRDEVETSTRTDLERMQLERLSAGVARVMECVPFYRDRLLQAGIVPESILTLDDLARLPFTTKDDLQSNYPFGLIAVPMDAIVRFHATSGTIGRPTIVPYTRNDIELWTELMARCLAGVGVTAADVIHNAFGYGLFTGGLGIHYGAERLGAAVIPVSGGNSKRQLTIMRDFGSTVLCCAPSYAMLLAETAEQEGIDIRSLSLRMGLFGAEPWSEPMRREIESRLGIVAYNIYGLSEVIGPGVSCECAYRQGMHICEDQFIVEVIDPETGQPLPDGEMGELVITCVTKEALPLIRYRTRDRTCLMRGPCACGRTTARMDRIVGRTDDMIIVRGVNVFPSQIEAVLLDLGDAGPHYQVVVDRDASYRDELDVLVEIPARIHGNEEQMVQLERRLCYEVQSALGISCHVKLVGPGTLARSDGKATHVVDRREMVSHSEM